MIELTDENIGNAYKVLQEYKDSLYDQVEIEERVYEKYGIAYNVWVNIPDEIKVSKKTIGERVWLADEKEEDSYTILKKYVEEGENDKFPDGGLVLWSKGTKYFINKQQNQAIRHPEEIDFSPEQLEKINTYNERVKEAKKKKYINPLTDRKCSYKYALQKGFITEVGEQILLQDMKFENPETGRMVSYQYAKQKGII